MRFFTIVLFVFSFITFSFSQNGQVSGKVIDQVSNEPKEYLVVKLLSSKDSTVKGIVYTDDKGFFQFDELKYDSYLILVQESGYEDFYTALFRLEAIQPISEHTIRLIPVKSDLLDEIVIRQEKKLIEYQLEKKVYNVSQDQMAKGASVADMMANIPSIDVDQDGNISLRGESNIIILIDGKPSSISGGARTIFESIPAESIDRIEIVNNPSAKYDADGTAGIINIVMKKSKIRGINGNFSLSAGTGNVYNVNGSISYMTSKMNAFATYGFRYYEGMRSNFIFQDRLVGPNRVIMDQSRIGSDLMKNHTFRAGSDFYLKNSNTIGFYVTGVVGDRERNGDMINRRFQNDSIHSDWVRRTKEPSSNYGFDFNLNYLKRFKENTGSISAELTQSITNNSALGLYQQDYALSDYYPSQIEDVYQRLDSDEKMNTTIAQVDGVKKIKEKSQLEFGAKSIFRTFDLLTSSTKRLESEVDYQSDTIADYDYNYKEQIHNLYGSWKQEFNRFSYSAGLRLELFDQRPNLISQNVAYHHSYWNAFPSLAMNYKLNDGKSIGLQFSRRINRPSSEQMNPFVSYTDPLNLRTGNPFLKPEYINAAELSFNYDRKKFSFVPSLFFRYATNVIQRVRWYSGDNVTTSSYDNIDGTITTGYELVAMYKPFSWWKNTLSSNGSFIKFIEDDLAINWNRKGLNWSIKYSGTFDFWKNTASLQINARYFSPIIMAQGKGKGRAVVDLAINKSLKNNKNWSFGLRLADVFNTQEFTVIIDQPGIYQTSRFKQNTRRLYFTVSYKFGKYEVTKKSQINTSSGGGDDS